MKQNKLFRAGLSLLLVLCMLLSVCPITVFAARDDRTKLNLVSFGDSMTNGYGHDGYYEEWTDSNNVHHSVQVNGFLQNDVKTTYPYYLKEELDKTYNVNWTALAISCMRTEDVNFLLRYHTNDDAWNTLAADLDGIDPTVDNWNNNQKSRWESTFIDDGNVIGDYFTWNEFVNGRFWDWKKTLSESQTSSFFVTNPTKAYASTYQNAVKNADVITLGMGNANFGVIMLQNITSYLTGTFGSGFKDAVPVKEVLQRRLPADIYPQALEILDKVNALVVPKLGMLGEEKAAKVLEIVEYTVASFMVSYIDMLDAIDELNNKDNLDVIMMGLMNTMDGVKLDLGDGQIFDLGQVVDVVTDVLSGYYFVLPILLQEFDGRYKNITFYSVFNDDHIEMQVSDMGTLESVKANKTIRERMIQEVSGMIFDLVRTPLNTALNDTGVQLPTTWGGNDNTAYQYREKVEAYEALLKSYTDWVDGGYTGTWIPPMNGTADALLQAPNDMLACAVYLAFERAIIENADNATLDVNGLMSLMDGMAGLGGMFDPIAASLTDALGEDAQKELENKVLASVFAQLVADGKAQYNNDTIKDAIGTQITEVEQIIETLTSASQDTTDAETLKTALVAIKDQPIVPVDGSGTAWYKLDLTSGDAAANMQSVGTTLSDFADSMNAEKDNNVVAAPTAMFTAIELTNVLNGALGTALVNEDSLGGLLSLFARMIIGNGIGSHPTANGHYTLFKEIMDVYPDKPVPEHYVELAQYYLYNYGAEALKAGIDFAAEKGYISARHAALIDAQIDEAAAYIKAGDIGGAYASAMKLGAMVSGYVNRNLDKVRAYIEKGLPYVEAYAIKLVDLAKRYGPAAIGAAVYTANMLGIISDEQIAFIQTQLEAVQTAIAAGDQATIMRKCKKLALLVYNYATDNGYIPEDLDEALTTVYAIYKGNIEGKTPEEIKAWAKAELLALADKYGPVAIEKFNEYVLSFGILNAQQLATLEEKAGKFFKYYKDAPRETVEKAVNQIVDYAFEATGLDRAEVEKVIAQCKAAYDYITTTSREEMIEDAKSLLINLAKKYGPDAIAFVEEYVVAQGWISENDLKALESQIKLAAFAAESGDDAAIKASTLALAQMIYDYADANGYIPAEVKEAFAVAEEIYNTINGKTPEEIKAMAVEELKKFITDHQAECLIALESYIVTNGWLSEGDIFTLSERIAAVIAAYNAAPEATADMLVKELVDYIYYKAVEAGYIDPAKVEEALKLVDLVKEAILYFESTPAEQLKADALKAFGEILDKAEAEADKYFEPEIVAQVKADLVTLIEFLVNNDEETIKATVNAQIEALKAKYEELLYNATHGEYTYGTDSYYVALGGGTVYGTGIGKDDDGYYNLIVEALKLDANTQFKNLGEDNLMINDLLNYVSKNSAEIAKADFITYQMDATAFILAVLANEDPDWTKYLTEDEIAFVDEAVPAIIAVLEDDWTKYVDLDVEAIVDKIEVQVLGMLDNAIMKAFEDQTEALNNLFAICVSEAKAIIANVQDKATELFIEATLTELFFVEDAFYHVESELSRDWPAYADIDEDAIVAQLKGYIYTVVPEAANLAEEKVEELLALCVEQVKAVHNSIEAQINAVKANMSEDEIAFVTNVYGIVWQLVAEQWSTLKTLNAEEIRATVEGAIKDVINAGMTFDYDPYVAFGEEKVREIINTCETFAMNAISTVQNNALAGVSMLHNAHSELFEKVFSIGLEILLADWECYADKTAAFICSQIKDAVIAELLNQSAINAVYADECADEITAMLELCLAEVQAVVARVQDGKNRVLDVINTLTPYKSYIEKLLFASVAYAVETAKAVDLIEAINPEATLVVVGMYNPLKDFTVKVAGEEVNIGEYTEYVVDATNAYYTLLAMADGGFTFVSVPDTTINGFEGGLSIDALDANGLVSIAGALLKFNKGMYADVKGHDYIFTEIMDAVEVSRKVIKVDNRTKEEMGEFDAEVTFGARNKKAYVECDEACVVLAKMENGTYVLLTAKAESENKYSFDLSGLNGDFTLTVALKGDYNLDGKVSTVDVARANKALVEETEPSELQKYVFDMNGDNGITTIDVAKVNRAIVTETPIEW